MRLFHCQNSCCLRFLYGSNAVVQHQLMQTDKWTDMMKLIGAFCDYVNVPENEQKMP
jgi:hypothetical protein